MTPDLEAPEEGTPLEATAVPDTQDTKLIIAMLNDAKGASLKREDKQDETNDHLHASMHAIDENVKGIKAYFIGLDPATHIIHHVRIGETEQTMKDMKKAIVGSIVSAVIAGAVGIMQYTANSAQKDLQAQVAELVKHQQQAQNAK